MTFSPGWITLVDLSIGGPAGGPGWITAGDLSIGAAARAGTFAVGGPIVCRRKGRTPSQLRFPKLACDNAFAPTGIDHKERICV
jgi:hypothetical protein